MLQISTPLKIRPYVLFFSYKPTANKLLYYYLIAVEYSPHSFTIESSGFLSIKNQIVNSQ